MRLEERLANSFISEGIISEEEREIVRYGLESIKGNLLGVCLTLGVGICFQCVGEALLLWGFLFPLRKNAGGYHANTSSKCLLASAGMLITSFLLFVTLAPGYIIIAVFNIPAIMFIWFLAPVGNRVKELDEIERRVYRRRSRMILVVEAAIFAAALCLQWEMGIRSISMCFYIVCVSLVAGRMSIDKKVAF